MTRSLVPVAAFTLVYLAIAAAVGVVRGNAEFLIYVGVMVILIGAVAAVHRRITLTMTTLWALSAWGLAHMAGGLVTVPASWPTAEGGTVLYALWLIPDRLKYDHVVHAYGFGVTTWVCWQGLRAILGATPQRMVGPLVLSAAAGLGFGALNEVIEFAATLILPSTGVGGYVNTGWDLVSNLVGATVAAGLIWMHENRSR